MNLAITVDSQPCIYTLPGYVYMYVRHTFGMQLNFYVTSWLRIYELRENFDRRPKEALVVSKVP